MNERDVQRLQSERDLYQRLLELGQQDSLVPMLREALSLVVEVTAADKGYIEILESPEDPDTVRWSMAHGCADEEVEKFRKAISSGIIAETLARGRVVNTASAVDDPRYANQQSVVAMRIQAVLCVPIGKDPSLGVLYLQGLEGAGSFSRADSERAKLFARHLVPVVHRLLAQMRDQEGNDPTCVWRRKLDLHGIVGKSQLMADVFRRVAVAAPAQVPVLLTGPSGTGKSQLARAIHANSPRRDSRFVEINCGAIPESLVESELFGALPGSFSGAVRRIRGKVEAARGGTLFLDELGELPLGTQVKLLTLLQEGAYYPVGSDTPSKADIRVIAATNMELDRAVMERRFREDLYHRLAVARIELPPLSERPEDVVELARHFCAKACERNGVASVAFSPAAYRAIRSAPWPGNIRELANKVEWAVLQAAAEGGKPITPYQLFPTYDDASDTDDAAPPRTWHEGTRQFQRVLLQEALSAHEGNRSAAARSLGISRAYLYEAMRTLGVSSDRT